MLSISASRCKQLLTLPSFSQKGNNCLWWWQLKSVGQMSRHLKMLIKPKCCYTQPAKTRSMLPNSMTSPIDVAAKIPEKRRGKRWQKDEQHYFKVSTAIKLGHLKTARKNTWYNVNSCLCFIASSIHLVSFFKALHAVDRKTLFLNVIF